MQQIQQHSIDLMHTAEAINAGVCGRQMIMGRNCVPRNRGVALMLVMIAVAMAVILSLSFVTVQSTSTGVAQNVQRQSVARGIAESALVMAINYVKTDTDWRTDQVDGEWQSNQSYNGGTFTIIGKDGEDTDGDGVVDGDGDLADDPADVLTLIATGVFDGVTHTVRAVVTPGSGQFSSLAYWELDETGGANAADSGGANDGTYRNGVTLGEGGAVVGSTAVRFDGGNDYVEISHSDAYLLDNGTVALWFNADNVSSRGELFSKDSQNYDTGGHLTMFVISGRLTLRLQSIASSTYVESSNVLQASTWHHAAVTFGADGLKLYLDGSLVDSSGYTGGLGTTSGGIGNYEPIVLGANTWISNDLLATPLLHYFAGTIDEVYMFDRALSAAEIQALMPGSSGQTPFAVRWVEQP